MFIKYEAEVSSSVSGGERGVVDFGKLFTETNEQKFSLGGVECKKICSLFGCCTWFSCCAANVGLSILISANTGSADRTSVNTARVHGCQFGHGYCYSERYNRRNYGTSVISHATHLCKTILRWVICQGLAGKEGSEDSG